MDVAIAGGHGKIALLLTPLLRERGDGVRALIRNPEHADDVRAAGGDPVVCDLEVASEGQVAAAIGSVDAIVYAAGAGPGSGAERKQTMDYGGAVKLIAAAKAQDVRRYVMVSSRGADPDHEGDDPFALYLRAKGRADAALEDAGLDHTIVAPVRLTDDAPGGLVEVAAEPAGTVIPRSDVAAVLAETLAAPNTIGKTFGVAAGSTPVAQAVAAA